MKKIKFNYYDIVIIKNFIIKELMVYEKRISSYSLEFLKPNCSKHIKLRLSNAMNEYEKLSSLLDIINSKL